MNFEPLDDFETELYQALERRPAPPGLKRRILERRGARPKRIEAHLWQRLAASIALAAVLGGGMAWRQIEERRKGEETRAQVLTALRITGLALDKMNTKRAARGRSSQE